MKLLNDIYSCGFNDIFRKQIIRSAETSVVGLSVSGGKKKNF